jgi:hypothetical protein
VIKHQIALANPFDPYRQGCLDTGSADGGRPIPFVQPSSEPPSGTPGGSAIMQTNNSTGLDMDSLRVEAAASCLCPVNGDSDKGFHEGSALRQ